MSRYVVGIDLGTTNSALAYAEVGESPDQVVAGRAAGDPAGRGRQRRLRAAVAALVPLPAGRQGVPRGGACSCRGSRPSDRVVGVFARDHGAKVPGRLVSSAKSWLSHAGVDRRAAILPWTAAEDVAQDLAGRGLVGLPGAPARRLERADRGQGGRRPAGEPGGLPDRAGLVRRRRARADHRGRRARPGSGRSRCWRSRRPPSTPGSPPRATSGGRR